MSGKVWRVLSWNVNGIRSAARKGFLGWLHEETPDILGVQETRAQQEELAAELTAPRGYRTHWVSAVKKGYSGVATFSRHAPLSIAEGVGVREFDDEGRLLITETPHFWVYNAYFPKGSGTARDNSRVPYKLRFYDAVVKHSLRVRKKSGKGVVVMGDFNTAPEEVDLHNARGNVKNSGFLPEEREAFCRHLERGFVDSFRHLHPGRVQYTWWSQRPGVRERNVGWRIDGVWVSTDLVPHLESAFIQDDVRGSDHCPVGVTLRF